jgi:cytochrome c biogenesis factor
VYGCTFGGLIAHIIRMQSGLKDNEIPLSKKQMLFIFSLLGLVILSSFLIIQFAADKSLAIILICSLALISGVYALFYVKNCIKKNKRNQDN